MLAGLAAEELVDVLADVFADVLPDVLEDALAALELLADVDVDAAVVPLTGVDAFADDSVDELPSPPPPPPHETSAIDNARVAASLAKLPGARVARSAISLPGWRDFGNIGIAGISGLNGRFAVAAKSYARAADELSRAWLGCVANHLSYQRQMAQCL